MVFDFIYTFIFYLLIAYALRYTYYLGKHSCAHKDLDEVKHTWYVKNQTDEIDLGAIRY